MQTLKRSFQLVHALRHKVNEETTTIATTTTTMKWPAIFEVDRKNISVNDAKEGIFGTRREKRVKTTVIYYSCPEITKMKMDEGHPN